MIIKFITPKSLLRKREYIIVVRGEHKPDIYYAPDITVVVSKEDLIKLAIYHDLKIEQE